MYAYFASNQTYWAFDESLELQALATIPISAMLEANERGRVELLSESCCGVSRLPSLKYQLLGVEGSLSYWLVKADLTELFEDGTALPQPFEVSRNKIILAIAGQLGWTEEQTAHAADNLIPETGDEHAIALSNGKFLRMPIQPVGSFYVRLTHLQFELARWEQGDEKGCDPGAEINSFVAKLLLAAGALRRSI